MIMLSELEGDDTNLASALKLITASHLKEQSLFSEVTSVVQLIRTAVCTDHLIQVKFAIYTRGCL